MRTKMKLKHKLKKNMLAAVLLMICMAFIFTSCGSDAAAKKVSEDLESLKAGEAAAAGTSGLASVLNDISEDTDEDTLTQMTADYAIFMAKVRDFDYEILATEEDPEEYRESADNISVVEVRINTYNFGKEYVKTWADYLEKEGASSEDLSEDFDETGFYKKLFRNLSEADDKDYMQTVKIKVTESEKDGTLTTDVNKNKKFHNAIMGGMLNEMNELAAR